MMKKLFKTIITFTLCAFLYANFGVASIFAQHRSSGNITYQTFYDELSPYGHWLEYPGYDHVWSPNVQGDFRPYLTNGNWDYTDEGWAWSSNYEWGWAPFHYGRWLYEPMYGWLWVPGYEWSPAWVTWGEVDDYYAWAPLNPGVNVGYAYDNWRPNSIYWNVVPREHIYDRDVNRYVESRRDDDDFVGRIKTLNNFNTTSIHNHSYSRGPEINEVEKYTGRKITPVAIKSVDKLNSARRDGNNLLVYRPAVVHPQPAIFKRATQDAPALNHINNENMYNNTNANRPANVNAERQVNTNVNRQENVNAERQVNTTANRQENANVNRQVSTNAGRQENANANRQENANVNRQENMNVRKAQSIENMPAYQNRESNRMPIIERSTQMQNVARMPQYNSPPNSFQRSAPNAIQRTAPQSSGSRNRK